MRKTETLREILGAEEFFRRYSESLDFIRFPALQGIANQILMDMRKELDDATDEMKRELEKLDPENARKIKLQK